jgi:uncharacterized membrane protein
VQNAEPAKLLAEVPLRVRGWVIRSSCSPEEEARLNAALSGGTGAVTGEGDSASGN